jgi:hypothetical protein
LREQVVETWAEWHSVNHEIDVFGELEPDDLKQIARMVGSDSKDLGWICIGLEVDDGEGMIEGVEDCGIRHSVLARRRMDLHIRNIVLRNSQEWKGCVIVWQLPDGDVGFDKPMKPPLRAGQAQGVALMPDAIITSLKNGST